MTISLAFIYLLSIWLIYICTKNITDFRLIFAFFVAPAAIAADYYVALLFTIGIFALAIGGLFFNLVVGKNAKKSLVQFQSKNISIGFQSPQTFFITWILLITFCFMMTTIYFSVVGFSIFAEEVGLARLESRHAISGSYIFQRLFRVFLPILCMMYFLFSFSELTKKYYKKSVLVLISLATLFFLVATGLRGNVLIFFFTPFVVLVGLTSKNIRFMNIIFFGFIVVGIGMGATKLMYGDVSFFEVIGIIFQRLSGAASDGIGYVVNSDIPENGFYFGQTYINDFLSFFTKLGLTSAEYNTYSAYIAEELLGNRYNGEAAAVYIFGEFYANFGYFGLFLGSFLVGFFFQFIYFKSLTINKSILRISVLAYLQGVLVTILGGPTLSMFIDYSITIILFFILYAFMSSLASIRLNTLKL